MQYFKDNLQVLIIMTIINFAILWNFISKDKTLHGIGYFIFFYVSILIIYFFTRKKPPTNNIEIKEPKKELAITIIFSIIGILFLTLNFMLKSDAIPDNIFTKIPIGLGSTIFAMPIGIIIYLLIKKYKPMKLGLTTQPLLSILLGLIIWGLTGLFAYIFNKEGMLWSKAYAELGGLIGIIIQGVIGASLFEEFSRFVIQSRFKTVFKSNDINILFATILWALMHFPVTYYKGAEISGSLVYCMRIIPIGFVWGYMTQRTKSIVPSTIAHGINLWGFQNG